MEKIDRSCQMRYCVNCGDEACYPFDWEEDGPDRWTVLLRCGNCDMYREDSFHQLEVEDFDEWLDDCQDIIRTEYMKLMKLNMNDEADNFARMLALDIITPEDF